MIVLKFYYRPGQYKLMARFHTRRQLEQWYECRSVQFESEQYADEYQYQYWFPGFQEHQTPPEIDFSNFWLQEWRSITVAASKHDDLPFALSWPEKEDANCRTVAKYESLGRILQTLNFRPRRHQGLDNG